MGFQVPAPGSCHNAHNVQCIRHTDPQAPMASHAPAVCGLLPARVYNIFGIATVWLNRLMGWSALAHTNRVMCGYVNSLERLQGIHPDCRSRIQIEAIVCSDTVVDTTLITAPYRLQLAIDSSFV